MNEKRPSIPRIYYVHPLMMGPMEAWGVGLDHAAGMGFETVLTAPLFDPGPCRNLFLTFDTDSLHPALGYSGPAIDGVGRLVDMAGARGLSLMIDLVIDRAASGGVLAGGLEVSMEEAALDPRIDPSERGAVPVADDGGAFDLIVETIIDLSERGVAGFRCLGVDRAPPGRWRDLIERVRAAAPGAAFLAWTPGLAFDRRLAIADAGFDAVFSSLRWWDCKSPWLVDEHDVHRRVGPAIAFPEAPFDRRLAADVDGDEDTRRAIGRALWLAASLGDGVLVPMGMEYGARDPMERTRGAPADLESIRDRARLDLTGEIAAVNRFLAGAGAGAAYARGEIRPLSGPGAPMTAVLRADSADVRRAERARLILVNPDLRRSVTAEAAHFLSGAGGRMNRYVDIAGSLAIGASSTIHLDPGEVRILEGEAAEPIRSTAYVPPLDDAASAPRFAIEAVEPSVDGGRFPVKRTVGDVVTVEADIVGDGHDKLAARLLFRAADEETWREARMRHVGNDRWAASLPLERLGRHIYTVETWKDVFATFLDELSKKHAAGLNVRLELDEGRRIVAETAEGGEHDAETSSHLKALLDRLEAKDDATRLAILTAGATADLMRAADLRRFRYRLDPPLPIDAERTGAGFAAWYELFPRSMSGDPARHGTFDDVIRELPRVRAMGFDVLYFPPIHPIGRINRKGRNNSLKAGPGDPGSPYAIGSEEGGHDAIHPELGTLDDFRRLIAAAADHGLEIALDFAIQCSPDHPWLRDHPEWFDWRPDGSIRYAENPPKKYEDIVNVDFYTPGSIPSLWIALRDVVLFWVDEGVRLFRVDNPHTKSFPFWEWLIADIRATHPDAVFLAEAFTRPKVMYRLAKIGFSQSYTYFTWRNTKWELESYLTELSTEAPKDFFRPHFFVNTPDINPRFLQHAPRSAYLIRAALATTLSGLWGMYNGFEVCEGRPVPGKEEYLDSEKYEIRAWDWSKPGNIVGEITQLNRIRRDNPALHSHLGVTFLPALNDRVMWFEKATEGQENVLLIAVSLDPHTLQSADVEVPMWRWGLPDHATVSVTDLMRGNRFQLTGKHQRIHIDPSDQPFFIWRIEAAKESSYG
ncbi:MAG TPA: alpha-1,4-glucan--maltose-1-phosphate maltosyltransferase [Methylomirabilota bacterium]|nr:alpha-1,4-glucan--maltose-1-phosphate maltosyltransferase [Methylomirabilota bacterium]